MDVRARKEPYPKYLYRAHIHGNVAPRFVDEDTGDFCDNFGSDLHRWTEWDAEAEISVPICSLTEDLTTEGIFEELSNHLNKTRINVERQNSGEELFLSRFVSLSGDFRWTAQRICRDGRTASDDEIPGLALFETSVIASSGGYIWRVADMLAFIDNLKSKDSDNISSILRRWARNADEYVCWDLVPRHALIAFVPLHDLTQQFDSREVAFLRSEFVNSTYLTDFRKCPLKRLCLEEYAERAAIFVRKIASNFSPWTNVEQLDINTFANWVLNPFEWGYNLAGLAEDLEERIIPGFEAEIRTAAKARLAKEGISRMKQS